MATLSKKAKANLRALASLPGENKLFTGVPHQLLKKIAKDVFSSAVVSTQIIKTTDEDRTGGFDGIITIKDYNLNLDQFSLLQKRLRDNKQIAPFSKVELNIKGDTLVMSWPM